MCATQPAGLEGIVDILEGYDNSLMLRYCNTVLNIFEAIR